MVGVGAAVDEPGRKLKCALAGRPCASGALDEESDGKRTGR